jgi:DNA-directed RNA polymerase subunit RPC12/RpoP
MKQNSEFETFRVEACDHCGKPFHIRAEVKTKAEGDEEIKVNCPYCDRPLMVKIPRRVLDKTTTFRDTVSRQVE